jgi:hypothetical protein
MKSTFNARQRNAVTIETGFNYLSIANKQLVAAHRHLTIRSHNSLRSERLSEKPNG